MYICALQSDDVITQLVSIRTETTTIKTASEMQSSLPDNNTLPHTIQQQQQLSHCSYTTTSFTRNHRLNTAAVSQQQQLPTTLSPATAVAVSLFLYNYSTLAKPPPNSSSCLIVPYNYSTLAKPPPNSSSCPVFLYNYSTHAKPPPNSSSCPVVPIQLQHPHKTTTQ